VARLRPRKILIPALARSRQVLLGKAMICFVHTEMPPTSKCPPWHTISHDPIRRSASALSSNLHGGIDHYVTVTKMCGMAGG
jgi:hypothetical protein